METFEENSQIINIKDVQCDGVFNVDLRKYSPNMYFFQKLYNNINTMKINWTCEYDFCKEADNIITVRALIKR